MDRKTIEKYYHQYGPSVYRRAYNILRNHEEAKDAMQEVFFKALSKGDGFREQSAPMTWLYSITTNLCLNWIRNKKRRTELIKEVDSKLAPNDHPNPELVHMVQDILHKVPTQIAQAAVYYYFDEMTHEGDFIFPFGKRSNKKLSNGLLDPRDLLLFMAHDAGDKILEEFWPKRISKSREIEVIDPIDKSSAWVYLFYFEKDPPPLCPLPDYVSYDYETETLGGKYWKVKYIIDKKGRHTNIYDTFHILPDAGGTGENFSAKRWV